MHSYGKNSEKGGSSFGKRDLFGEKPKKTTTAEEDREAKEAKAREEERKQKAIQLEVDRQLKAKEEEDKIRARFALATRKATGAPASDPRAQQATRARWSRVSAGPRGRR